MRRWICDRLLPSVAEQVVQVIKAFSSLSEDTNCLKTKEALAQKVFIADVSAMSFVCWQQDSA